tara:strand:+ start:2376 stop:3500 length:1125 start_codon:yes stop_codon:yes gene_type:complete
MSVGEDQKVPQDPALDAFASAGFQIEGYDSKQEDAPDLAKSESEPLSEQGETPNQTDTDSSVAETEPSTESSENSFDESKFLEEISGDRFKNREELNEAIRRSEQFDDLRNAYDELEVKSNREPEFANSLVKELNDFVSNGGDPNTFIKLISVDHESMSDVDIVAAQLLANNPNLTAQEAQTYVKEKYKLDEDVYAEKDNNIGKIDLRMQASKAKQEFTQIKEKALKDNTDNSFNYDEWNETNLKDWNEPLTNEVFSLEKLKFELPDGLGEFEYNVTEKERDSLDDKMYDLIEEIGMEYNQDNLVKAKQIAEDTFFLENKEKIINSIVQSAVSKIKEGNYKESHNPSPIPTEESSDTGGETRDEGIAKLIARNW